MAPTKTAVAAFASSAFTTTDMETLAWPDAAPANEALLPLVAQDALTGQVLMLGYVNREALAATAQNGFVTFWSRSRQRLWRKGEESGHVLRLQSLHVDCDRDTILALVEPHGPTCHRLTPTCFGELHDAGKGAAGGCQEPQSAASRIGRLARAIEDRKHVADEGSYTGKLFAAGIDRILRKCGEEMTEFVVAAKNLSHAKETASASDVVLAGHAREMAGEAADIIYHVLTALSASGLSLVQVAEALAAREGKRREGASLAPKV